MTPSYTQPSPAADKPVEFSVGQRQLAAIGFVSFLLLGLVATMSYVAGRITSPPAPTARIAGAPRTAAATAVPEAPKAAVEAPRKPPVEQLIMVEAQTPPAAPPAPAPTVTVPTPVPAAAAGVRPQPTPTEKLVGNTYLQVAAVDRGMAEVTCELLMRKGLPALIGDSPSEGIFRVLVGPIRNAAEVPSHQAVLAEAGFHPFVKKYN